MFFITCQTILNNDLEVLDNYQHYGHALSRFHQYLDDFDDNMFIKITNNDCFYLHKRGYVYGSTPIRIYRICEVEDPKKELKEKSKKVTIKDEDIVIVGNNSNLTKLLRKKQKKNENANRRLEKITESIK